MAFGDYDTDRMVVRSDRAQTQQLQYWRAAGLPGTMLLHARYGRFEWGRHVHDELVIVVPERGVGEVRNRTGTERGGAGSVMLAAPGEYHWGRVEADDGWEYRAFYVDLPETRRIGTHFDVEHPVEFMVAPGAYDDASVAVKLLAAHRAAQDERRLMEAQAAWSDALFYVFSRYGRPKVISSERRLGAAVLALARDYLTEHYRDNVSIDDLASRCGVSRYHLMRAFRERYGLPPHAYLIQLRLQAARRLLLAGSSVVDAALETGFYDQSRLSRFFRRSYGISPSRYANAPRG